MADRTVAAIVNALEHHRAVTAALLDRLDSLVERGEAAESLVGPFSTRLREDDRALEPLVDQLARH